MAIVYTHRHGNAICHVEDDYLSTLTEEQIQANCRAAEAVALRILQNPEARRKLREMYAKQDAEAAAKAGK